MNHCVVIGGTHHNTLSVVRSLGKEGVEVDVILEDECDDKSYVLTSRYAHKYYKVKDAHEAIKVFREQYSNKFPVIFCSDDVAALYNKDTACYMNKQVQVELAKDSGFVVPESSDFVVGNDAPAVPCFPCIVKPLESINGGKRFAVCQDKKDLLNVLSAYDKGVMVQIQQYVERDYEIVVDGVCINDDIITPGYILKYRDYLGGTSFSTTYPIEILPKDICEKIKKMVAKIGHEGLFGVELIISNNEYYFIEINLRNDATTYALAVAGVNLPYIYFLAKQGLDYHEEANKVVREINSIVEFRDFPFVLKGKVSPWQWWKDYSHSECKYFYDKADMDPFRLARNQFICSLFGKVIKRLK